MNQWQKEDLSLCLSLSLSTLPVKKRERERERERERGLPFLLVYPPRAAAAVALHRSEARSQVLLLVSLMGAGPKGGLGPSSTAFPGHSRELDWKTSNRDRIWHPNRD